MCRTHSLLVLSSLRNVLSLLHFLEKKNSLNYVTSFQPNKAGCNQAEPPAVLLLWCATTCLRPNLPEASLPRLSGVTTEDLREFPLKGWPIYFKGNLLDQGLASPFLYKVCLLTLKLNLDQNDCLGSIFISPPSPSSLPGFQNALSRLEPRPVICWPDTTFGEPTRGWKTSEDIWKKHCWFGAPWKKKIIKGNSYRRSSVWAKLKQH